MNQTKVLTWKCKKCGKKIESIYQKQFSFLIKQHDLSHTEKEKIENVEE